MSDYGDYRDVEALREENERLKNELVHLGKLASEHRDELKAENARLRDALGKALDRLELSLSVALNDYTTQRILEEIHALASA